MKFEPWVPNFMRKIAEIWREDTESSRVEPARTLLPENPVYVYGIETSGGVVEVRSHIPLDVKPGRTLLRIE